MGEFVTVRRLAVVVTVMVRVMVVPFVMPTVPFLVLGTMSMFFMSMPMTVAVVAVVVRAFP